MRYQRLSLQIAAATMILVPAEAVHATDWHIELEPASTSISFTLKATMHTVEGRASLVSGSLRFGPDTGIADGEIVVDATSADTANRSRDKKMHSRVLLSQAHPTIVLRPRGVIGDLRPERKSAIEIEADLELLGKAHPIRIPLTVQIHGGLFTADGTFEIPYVEWGLEDPSTFVLRVAKEVRVNVSATGTITVAEPLP